MLAKMLTRNGIQYGLAWQINRLPGTIILPGKPSSIMLARMIW
jgi:hypothetical protein